jgi:hypothetical protein
MKKVAVALFCLAVLAGIAPLSVKPAAGGQASSVPAGKKETTIRNLTKETVRYSIRRLGGDTQPQARFIKPEALDRWPCDSPLDVSFERSGGQQGSYRLECGLPYTFRYDESGNLDLYSGSHGLFGVADLAPFVPTPMAVVEKMLELGEVDGGDVLFDLGCGDGRIVITAAQKFGTHGVGIDIDPQRIEESRRGAKEAGVEGLVEFRLQDVMKADIRKATVVTLYLLPESNALLRPLLEEQLSPGTPVVSHNYSIPGWEAKETGYLTLQDGTGQEHTIFVYKR